MLLDRTASPWLSDCRLAFCDGVQVTPEVVSVTHDSEGKRVALPKTTLSDFIR